MDRDFILSKDNFFFCVIGYDHPYDRAISYLKYIPNESGKWKFGNQSLKRVLPHYSAASVKDTFQFLKKYPNYLFDDKLNNIEISAVPVNLIQQYYNTTTKINELIYLEEKDPLQKKLMEFITYLTENNNLKFNDFGVTGSILIDIHDYRFSDIDLTISGLKNAETIKNFLLKEFKVTNRIKQFKNNKELEDWILRKSLQFDFDHKIVRKIANRQWNFGYFDNTRFSIHPIRSKNELINNYGTERFKFIDFVKIHAEIKSSNESYFLPAVYKIKNVDVINGIKVENLDRIISFEGLYCNIVSDGEVVEAFGKLENVFNLDSNRSYQRLVIGSFEAESRDYIIPIS
ncbi:MAG: hypothetical protein ACTSPY_14395 [Candidatus Helarchaeota archaeon]